MILLSILADLNKAVVWMNSTRVLISISSSFFINPLITVPSAAITIGINVTFTFDSFFQLPSKVNVIFTFLQCYSVVCWIGKVYNSANSLFFDYH